MINTIIILEFVEFMLLMIFILFYMLTLIYKGESKKNHRISKQIATISGLIFLMIYSITFGITIINLVNLIK